MYMYILMYVYKDRDLRNAVARRSGGSHLSSTTTTTTISMTITITITITTTFTTIFV